MVQSGAAAGPWVVVGDVAGEPRKMKPHLGGIAILEIDTKRGRYEAAADGDGLE